MKKRVAEAICILLAFLIALTSCQALQEALEDALSSELSSNDAETESSHAPETAKQTGQSKTAETETSEPSIVTPAQSIVTPAPSTVALTTDGTTVDTPTTTPTETPTQTPAPSTDTPTPTTTPENAIPFRNEPEIPEYKLPPEDLSDPIDREAAQIIDAAIEKAIAAVTVLRDDRHSDAAYGFVEDANGYTDALSNRQKDLYALLVGYAENFGHFEIDSAEYGGDIVSDALTVAKPLMLNRPDLDGYFSFKPANMFSALTDSYFDPYKDGNYTVANGDITMEEVEHRAALLAHIVRRVVDKMPAGLSTYDKYFYLAAVLCAHVTYDSTLENSFTPFGALIGGRCVCEGYARAYLLLCREADLWCAYRSGTPAGGSHIWNMVKLDSGIYNVDVTWCDNYDVGSKKWYARFMKSDEAFEKDGHNAVEGVKGTGFFEPSPYEKSL